MADYTDVENVLKGMVASIVYPNGTGQASIANCGVRIFRGWPSGPQLDADMGAGIIDVSIYSQMNVERVTTRYPTERKVSVPPVTSITVTTTDNTATFAGAVNAPQYATVVINTTATAYSYPIQVTDNPTTIAAALAVLIPGASAMGAKLTVPGQILAVRIGAAGTLARELRRQLRAIQLTIFAPSDALRTAVGLPIDAALAAVDRIALPDGYGGRLLYTHAIELDSAQLVKIYERRMFYTVDYPTTDATPGYEITAPNVTPSQL
jgi:hypothetical protein